MTIEKRCEIIKGNGIYRLSLNGEVIDKIPYKIVLTDRKIDKQDEDLFEVIYVLSGFGFDLLDLLTGISISELPFSLYRFNGIKLDLPICIDHFNATFDSDHRVFDLYFQEKFDNWDYGFSPNVFRDEVEKRYREFFSDPSAELVENEISIGLKELDVDISEEFRTLLEISSKMIWDAWIYLSTQSSINLKVKFVFPVHLKSACEQYLMYFGQFLAEAGEKVNVNLSHSGQATLFEVVPENSHAGLKKIHEALSIYLQVSEFRGTSSGTLSLAEGRFQTVVAGYQAQIMSLQAEQNARILQLQSADSMLKTQTTVIEQQGQFIVQQGETILAQAKALEEATRTGNILAASLKEEQDDTEDIIPNLVKVKPYEIGPFELDIPGAIRKVREIFARPDDEK